MSANCSECHQGGMIHCLDPKTCPKFAIVAEEREMTQEDFASLFGNPPPKTRATTTSLTQFSGHITQDTGWDTLRGAL